MLPLLHGGCGAALSRQCLAGCYSCRKSPNGTLGRCLYDYHHNRRNLLSPPYPAIIQAVFERANSDGHELRGAAHTRVRVTAADGSRSESPNLEFARCFLRLANLPNFALDRLSHDEANLWRQAGRILFALDAWIAESHKKGHAVVTLATVRIQRLTL
jgi:hypothetical protein